jgi:hypothetical protein
LCSLICFFSNLCITNDTTSRRGHTTPLLTEAGRQALKGLSLAKRSTSQCNGNAALISTE